MKKIPKSISVTVRRSKKDPGRLVVAGKPMGAFDKWVEDISGERPEVPYIVTYKISTRGRYTVEANPDECPCVRLNKTGNWTPACFLPESWHGLRVSREVTPIRGKK